MRNKVELVGRLGKKPELQGNGTNYCTLNIAVDSYSKDREGNRQKKTDWFFVKVWKKTAENCVRYLDKGSLVLVDGVLRNNKWNDNGQEKSRLEIHALDVLFLDRKNGSNDNSYDDSYGGSSDVPF